MSMRAGTRLGAHEILSVLGAGGMGEVYRARDTRLGREVAIKVVLDAFAADADRVARFQREAKVLASLNHPHIAALYGIEEADGRHFLVMELVEGQTLADRLVRGPLPVAEALAIAVQIADALETAHEKGIVHRDLKPANVKITPDDQVKVLDFGLAKAVETEATASTAANSPTLSMLASQAGVILGTAAYMSPEQAKGFPADHRSDVFSFGSVLFEMLCGRQPFQGDTAPEILASVLVREPELTRLPPNLNPRLADLVRRCLEKSPKRRWQAIGDVRAELEAIAAAPAALPVPIDRDVARRPLWQRGLPVVASALIVGALAAAAAWTLKPPPAQPVVRFSIVLDRQRFSAPGRQVVAVSPDGTLIAYVGDRRLMLRPIGALESTALAGTENGEGINSPAFSPDGKWLAFFAIGEQAIKRIAVSGGGAVTLCTAYNPTGLTWDASGVVFGQAESRQVLRVSPTSAKPEVLVTLPQGEIPDGPQILPGGQTILLTSGKVTNGGINRWDKAQIIAQSVATGARTLVIDGGSGARYLPSGHIAYTIDGTVYAVPFDLGNLKVTGEAVPILEGVRRAAAASTGMADFVVSDNGTLAYVPGPAILSGGLALALFDWQGGATPLTLPAGPYSAPRVSPDGTRVAIETSDAKERYIGVYYRAGTATLHRLTLGGNSNSPVWSPDSTRIAFQSAREGDLAIFALAADGSGAPQRLTRPAAGEQHVPQSWFGDVLLFDAVTAGETTLWQLSVKDGKTSRFGDVRSANDTGAVFSPNGRWVAYSVVEGYRSNLFVQPFPATGAKYMLVKMDGSSPHHPMWSADGTMLSYVPGPALVERVSVTTAPAFSYGNPEAINRTYQAGPPGSRRMYDTVDNGHVIGLVNPSQVGSAPQRDEIRVVLNWFDELRSRLPR